MGAAWRSNRATNAVPWTLEYCVLALLREQERYAFDLVKTLGESDGMVTSEGTIYPLLSRLRRDGLVTTTWEESPSGPPRRYYRLTPEGERALAGFVDEWLPARRGASATPSTTS
jgi:PadR family transcriptional regulator PadR